MGSEATPTTPATSGALAALASARARWAARLGWQIGWRVLVLMALVLLMLLALQPPRPASAIVLAIAAALMLVSLVRLLTRTQRDLARLIDALVQRDPGARFAAAPGTTGDALAAAMNTLVEQLRAPAAETRAEALFWRSVVDHAPLPLLVIDEQDPATPRVELLNPAARRLLGRVRGPRLDDFSLFGADFVAVLARGEASASALLQAPDDAPLQLRITQSRWLQPGPARRLVALQPVQGDVDEARDALTRGLVRVLTHEVMNALTPVTSLTQSLASDAAAWRDDAAPGPAQRAQWQAAAAAASRRAGGLMAFVERFRTLARVPQPQRVQLDAGAWVAELATLFRAEFVGKKVRLTTEVDAELPALDLDPTLMTPALANVLRNAAQAALARQGDGAAAVHLHLGRTAQGRMRVDVHDNGAGIAAALREDVFLPFFSTRSEGHGVGLALARQVLLAHGGSISAGDSPHGGACLRLVW